jgi:hypothetical protein
MAGIYSIERPPLETDFAFELNRLHRRALEFAVGFALFHVLALVELLLALADGERTFTLPFFQ